MVKNVRHRKPENWCGILKMIPFCMGVIAFGKGNSLRFLPVGPSCDVVCGFACVASNV